jgi:putative transposase
VILTYRYRVKGSAASARLNRMAISVNQVWNFCGQIQHDSRRLNRRWPSAFDLMKLASGCTRELGIHSDTVNETCKQFAASRDRAKRRPRWRVSFGKRRSLGWVPLRGEGRCVHVAGDTVTLLGRAYRVWLSRPIPEGVRSGSFSQDSTGKWFINLVCEAGAIESAVGGEIGIDLGLKDFAAFSNGEIVGNPRHVRNNAARLAKAQRAGRKALARKIHRKVAAQRRDFLHKLSTRIANDNSLVVVGNVNSAKLAKTKMAKSVLDAGWSAFRSMLRYKIAMRPGAVFVEADERMSTQTCSDCGVIGGPKGLEGLRVRTWVCDCGSVHDRDVNASRNILRSGRSVALQLTGIAA